MVSIDVLTADQECDSAPKEAIGKFFVSLGSQHHNYGRCYELICWINIDDDTEKPHLSLLYTFEYHNCKVVHQVPIEYVINKLKIAINVLSKSNNNMYQDYMLISSKRSLDHLLSNYSFYRYQVKMAEKIKSKWIYHYYTPTSKICVRVRTRQFMSLQEELLSRPKCT